MFNRFLSRPSQYHVDGVVQQVWFPDGSCWYTVASMFFVLAPSCVVLYLDDSSASAACADAFLRCHRFGDLVRATWSSTYHDPRVGSVLRLSRLELLPF